MEEEYWNNIMVGDTHSNDSQQFFDRRREAMQKVKGHAQFQPLAIDPFDDITAANQQRPGQPTMGSKELMSLLEPVTQKRREAAAAADTGNKENESEKLLRMVEQRIGACTIKDERKPSSTQASAAAAANVQPSKRAAASGATTTTTAKATRSADTSPRVFKVPPAVKRTASAASVRPLSAAAAGPSTAVAVVPNAYRYKAIYEQKLQRKTERLLEEERQARRVVARPMPNFEQAHRQLEHKQSNRPLTCPNTPKTLKYSLQSAERMKQRHEEYLRQKYAKVHPKARPAEVLVRAPYKPRIESRQIEAEPFQMVGHERIDELREIRERRNAENELRRQQELLEEEEKERQLRLQQRKNTVFKARPNPFS